MRNWLKYAVLVLLAASTSGKVAAQEIYKKEGRQFQNLQVMSNGGASCRLFRDRKLLGTADIPSGEKIGLGTSVIVVDITASKADILTVCRLADKATSRTVQFGPVTYVFDFAHCVASEHRSAEEDRAEAECLKRPTSAAATFMQYPEIIRLFFNPPAADAIESMRGKS
jgi:hypothetical protein